MLPRIHVFMGLSYLPLYALVHLACQQGLGGQSTLAATCSCHAHALPAWPTRPSMAQQAQDAAHCNPQRQVTSSHLNCGSLLLQVTVAQKVTVGVYKGVTTSELDELAAETAASMTATHPDYALVSAHTAAVRILLGQVLVTGAQSQAALTTESLSA